MNWLDKVGKFFLYSYEFIRKYWRWFLASISIVLIIVLAILIYRYTEVSKEESLKKDFDMAFYSYISSLRSDRTSQGSYSNFIVAMEDISKQNNKYPVVSYANLILGDIYFDMGNLELALSYYQNSIHSRSEFFTIQGYYKIAQVYESKRDFEDSISNYEKIYKDYPNSFLAPSAMFSVGRIHFIRGDINSSISIMSEITNKYTNSSIYNLAKYFLIFSDFKVNRK